METKKKKSLTLGQFLSFLLPIIIVTPFIFIFQPLSDSFVDLKKEPRSIIDFGFAIYIALTSIMFGWLRAEEDEKLKKGIKLTSVICLYTCIMFLIVTSLKYAIMYDDKYIVSKVPNLFMILFRFLSVHNYFAGVGVIVMILFCVFQFFNTNYKGKF